MRGHQEGSITRLKDGRYQVRLSVDGKRRAFYAKSYAQARALLKEKRTAQAQGQLMASSSQTVERYLWEWHSQRAQAVSYATATNYAANIRRAVPHIGRLKLDELKPAHLDALYAAKAKEHLSAASIGQLHRTLRAAFSQAVKKELLWRNPALGATPPRKQSPEQAIPRPQDIQRLLRGTADHHLGLLWSVLATTGLRSGEAIGLRWQDIDFEQGQLTVCQSNERRTGEGIVAKETKTAKSRRTVLLLPDVVTQLRTRRDEQIDLARDTANFPPTLVFVTGARTPYDVSAINRHFHQACDRCGLPPYRVHALRHAVTTHLIGRGVPAPVVQLILGHASAAITAEVYTHLIAAHQEQARPYLAELLPAG